ncbi:methyltransferase domain-containing protein [Micromonospora sp. WMMA1363]|uniref:methyltransferase domain-containing protein n=1 Tax=Micromonospora sp. WMMA1363 TaxID=3053985 RepID=UPI00259D07DF|nr:methyltransferase domain-containing protein [Micromonospora sp. WMMA1363]MDM4719657.1 methyltransferase domain-containing protein [Micromonospora sp. WMMA1363]
MSLLGRRHLGGRMTTENVPAVAGVERFYDVADLILTTIWGRNWHVGYWDSSDSEASNADAVQRLNDVLAATLRVGPGNRVLDVGCGIGEPALRLAEVTGAEVVGVTIAEQQVVEGNRRAAELGLADRATFQLGDGLNLPFQDGAFDAAWEIESGIHMDRARMIAEMARVVRPGGRVLVADLAMPEGPARETPEERRAMLESMALVQVPTVDDYHKMIADAGLRLVELSDITPHTRKTNERMAEAARQHYDVLVAERGRDAGDILDMMMTSIDVRYVVVVADRPMAS